MFKIVMGVPEIKAYWENLCERAKNNTLGNDKVLFKKLVKCLDFLRNNPKHNSLLTHEIKQLSNRFGKKVFQSYLENKTPSAGRIFWVYRPEKNQITIIVLESHPEDKKRGSWDNFVEN